MIHTVKSLKSLLREYKHLHNFAYSKMKKHELLAIAIKLGLVEDVAIKKENVKIPKKEIVKPKKQISNQNIKEISKKEESFDDISSKLQQLIYITPIDKVKKALVKLKFKGRIQTNPIMLNMQLLQNFKNIDSIKELIKALKE